LKPELSTNDAVERNSRSDQTHLHQVLKLGQELLSLAQQVSNGSASAKETLTAQKELTIETAAHLLNGRASLWLSNDFLRSYLGKRPYKNGDRPASTPSVLIQHCINTNQACGGFLTGKYRALPNLHEIDEPGFHERASSQTVKSFWTILDQSELASASTIAVPMLSPVIKGQNSSLIGVLQVERPTGSQFTEIEIDQLKALAIQVAMTLHSSLQITTERWRQEQLLLVEQVSMQIADACDIDELTQQVADLICNSFDYYYVAIFTLEPGDDILHFRASAGPPQTSSRKKKRESFSPRLEVHIGKGIIGNVAQSGEEIIANDVLQDSTYQYHDTLPETRSEAALPLVVQDRLLGVLDVQSDQPNDFNDSDMLVLHALAGNIAIAIEGARLYSALIRRTDRLQAIYETSSAITSILDQDQLLDGVITSIQQRFGYPFVYLFTVDQSSGKVDGFYHSSEVTGGMYQKLSQAEDSNQGFQELVERVARVGKTILVNGSTQLEVNSHDQLSDLLLPPEGSGFSELAVPLIFGGKLLGVLDIRSDLPNAFGEEDRFMFEALAGNIAIAMRNAYLYRSETWRRQVADSLREVAGLLSADVDLDQVLEAILEELEQTLPLDIAAIWLLDTDNANLKASVSESSSLVATLRLAAMRCTAVEELDIELGFAPEEILEYVSTSLTDENAAQASTWLLESLMSDNPILRTSIDSIEPLGAALGYPSGHSAIAAPLRVGDQPVGVLTLTHHSQGRYGDEAKAMTAAFASYAAVAIENTRLYEAAHEQAWISTVLLQVAEATQSFTSLNDLLDTVVRITPMLVGVGACLLYILDDDNTFVPAAASGLGSEQRAEFERWRFAPGDTPALDRLIVDRHPVILSNFEDDQRLLNILSAPSSNTTEEVDLLVLVPLLARDELLGVILVQYNSRQAGGIQRSLEDFLDDKLAILQGIAHQTAIAIDNIHLLKSQKEEAYISVALLQVAQAVVSSNDLDEALGSIVRITPILVGVSRAVIYKWDAVDAAFTLVQAYGLPRDVEKRQYHSNEFPLLDEVILQDRMIACPLICEDTAFEDVHQVWNKLPVPDPDTVNQYLENEACLLIAVPLSIKGITLGVFLVEEPASLSVGTFNGHQVNLHLREKRLEIIKGISHQASLAIQNDQLQREIIERERLERELQLAHEIQRAFLPQKLPNLPGWDFEVYWQTAREVGGDFYDIIELSGKRMGLVIADVADKGMPAALFMTLVRTLMRATVHGTRSPAEVLKRVNRLLVPDAPKGMFVTIVYAVLYLETGVLEYANAGHNPPLVLKSPTRQLERLTRTGMALGIQKKNQIEEKQVILDPNDCLIMYTDGLTEAFSPDGELFGEDRLKQVIWQSTLSRIDENGSISLTARELLQDIHLSLETFSGGIMPSDDLTLVVLKNSLTSKDQIGDIGN